MKNRNLIEKAIAASSEADVKMLLAQFLASQTSTKAGKFDLAKWCAKDELRPAMNGVCHDPEGWKVATNAHILAAVRCEIAPEDEGVIITPKGKRMRENYPNWRAVCPTEAERSDFNPVVLDVRSIREAVKLWKPIVKDEGLTMLVEIEHPNGKTYYKEGFLSIFLDFMSHFEIDAIHIKDASRCALAECEQARALIMPAYLPDRIADEILVINQAGERINEF